MENVRKAHGEEGSNIGGVVDVEALRRYVSRAMALLDERDNITADLKEVYEEASADGFVKRHIRQLVREQRMDAHARERHLDEMEQMDTLRHALGDFASSDLGRAAMERQAQKPPKRPVGRPRKNRAQETVGRADEELPPFDVDDETPAALH